MENIITFRSNKNRPVKVNELLRLYRTRSNLTQNELAQRLTLQSDRMVRKWENGQSLPEPIRLKKLIEVFLRERVFTAGQELEEAQNFWAAVKAVFEFQSSNFETYNIFDSGWFEALIAELALNPGARVAITPDKLAPSHATIIADRHNLPIQLTSLIGRENELSQIKARLESARVLTLTGPVGVGKTRLALAVSFSLRDNFKDGVRLVMLDTLPGPEFLIETIANIVGLGGNSGPARTVEELINYLRAKELLMVLDECDTIVRKVGALLDRLLKGCPHLTVLATSGESLGIGGEKIFQVRPLSQVELGSGLPHEIGGSDAVSLFIERAAAVQPDFKLSVTQQAIQTIGRICRQLDGLPLAIELAASLVEGLAWPK